MGLVAGVDAGRTRRVVMWSNLTWNRCWTIQRVEGLRVSRVMLQEQLQNWVPQAGVSFQSHHIQSPLLPKDLRKPHGSRSLEL